MGVVDKERGRVINAGDFFVIPMKVDGTLASGNSAAFYKALHTGFTVKDILATVQTLPTTSTGDQSNLIQVRNLTDTADLLDTADRIDFTDTTDKYLAAGAANIQNAAIALNDVVAVDVDAAGGSAAAKELTVYLVAERTPT